MSSTVPVPVVPAVTTTVPTSPVRHMPSTTSMSIRPATSAGTANACIPSSAHMRECV